MSHLPLVSTFGVTAAGCSGLGWDRGRGPRPATRATGSTTGAPAAARGTSTGTEVVEVTGTAATEAATWNREGWASRRRRWGPEPLPSATAAPPAGASEAATSAALLPPPLPFTRNRPSVVGVSATHSNVKEGNRTCPHHRQGEAAAATPGRAGGRSSPLNHTNTPSQHPPPPIWSQPTQTA